MLRLSGKRTLSKLNVFDFVFVVAVGSVFASMIVSKDVTLVEGVAAMGTLENDGTLTVAWISKKPGTSSLVDTEDAKEAKDTE